MPKLRDYLWDLVDFFEPEEFKDDPSFCSPLAVLAMDRLRKLADTPIIIHRCWAADGHVGHSYHYTGQAVDFHFKSGLTPIEEFAAVCAVPDFMGVGFYPSWNPRPGWHVDLRSERVRLYWCRINSAYRYGFKHIAKALGGQYG